LTVQTIQHEPTIEAPLIERCRRLSVPLVTCDVEGNIVEHHVDAKSWLADHIVKSNLFAQMLSSVVKRWADADEPAPRELWEGCWAAPLPIMQRRRVTGYHVALCLTEQVVESEQFSRIIDSAKLDVTAVASMCAGQPWCSVADVDRIGTMLRWMVGDLNHRDRHDREIATLSQQLAETYEELSLLYKLSAGMTVTQEHGRFLEESLAEMQQVVGLKWMALQLCDDDPRLQAMRGRLYTAGRIPIDTQQLGRTAANLLATDELASTGGVRECAQLNCPELSQITGRILFAPLKCDGKSLGLIFGAQKLNDEELSSVDSKLVTSMAQSISIFLTNAMLYEDLQDMFMGTLRSLVNAIDAKDAYTCGHSERVAYLGRELGKAAGLDDGQVERLYLSGLLHDVGKIGVPEAVLTKPGRLTDEEFDTIKAHPRMGARILEDIRQVQDLIPGVLYHHERWDGRGYPDKLAGMDIPLFGRLLCLADSFDAMSSTRTYREALPLEKVLKEVLDCAGTQFDPELAKLFVKLDFEPYFEMIRVHQSRESLLRRELEKRT